MNELNNKLVRAFLNQEYRECKELIEQGAEGQVIIEYVKKFYGGNFRRLSMTQDMIIRDLT